MCLVVVEDDDLLPKRILSSDVKAKIHQLVCLSPTSTFSIICYLSLIQAQYLKLYTLNWFACVLIFVPTLLFVYVSYYYFHLYSI